MGRQNNGVKPPIIDLISFRLSKPMGVVPPSEIARLRHKVRRREEFMTLHPKFRD